MCLRICHLLRMNRHIGIGLIRDVVDTILLNQKKLKEFNYPLLIFHGKSNYSIPYQDIYKTIKHISSGSKTLKLIENGFIELYCDTEKEGLAVFLIDWIMKRVNGSRNNAPPCLGQLSHLKLKTAPRRGGIFNAKNIALFVIYALVVR